MPPAANVGSSRFVVRDRDSSAGSFWKVVATDNRQYTESSLGYNQFPEPTYAFGDTPLNPGECARGWIVYPVANDAQLTTVRYQSDTNGPFYWQVPAS